MDEKIYKTDFLFSKGSFFTGMGNVFNIAGRYHNFNTSASDQEANKKALRSNWKIVGQTMRKCLDEQKQKEN